MIDGRSLTDVCGGFLRALRHIRKVSCELCPLSGYAYTAHSRHPCAHVSEKTSTNPTGGDRVPSCERK